MVRPPLGRPALVIQSSVNSTAKSWHKLQLNGRLGDGNPNRIAAIGRLETMWQANRSKPRPILANADRVC